MQVFPTIGDKPQGDTAQRAIWWGMFFSELLLDSPDLRAQIPEGAKVCVMPVEDPELTSYNVGLALRNTDKPVVFVKLERSDNDYRITPYLPQATYHQAPV